MPRRRTIAHRPTEAPLKDVSVIIPARDASATVAATLEGLATQTFDGAFEVLVVDDGSSDKTLRIAQGAPVDLRVIPLQGRGPSAARNAGASAAVADILAFIDADCRPGPEWLRAGVQALRDADLVQGMTRPDPRERVGPFDRSLWVVRPSPLYESANLFMRRELFERLGGFEAWLVPRSGKELGEDVWFGWRARRAGARIVFCRDAVADHAVFARGLRGYISERARLRFFPALTHRIPELREELLWARYFHSPRSAAFDAAIVGASLALLTKGRATLAVTAPYAWMLCADCRGRGALDAAKVTVAGVAADAVGCAALLTGSVRYRAPVL
jgi:glycosyltransferase involved in cell wall biosynthesis